MVGFNVKDTYDDELFFFIHRKLLPHGYMLQDNYIAEQIRFTSIKEDVPLDLCGYGIPYNLFDKYEIKKWIDSHIIYAVEVELEDSELTKCSMHFEKIKGLLNQFLYRKERIKKYLDDQED
jgi:hypothetical protein